MGHCCSMVGWVGVLSFCIIMVQQICHMRVFAGRCEMKHPKVAESISFLNSMTSGSRCQDGAENCGGNGGLRLVELHTTFITIGQSR